ncbi:hypothetical protein P154DRAFT_440938 [Amniculicola lignicola CBS 123094]|uniref:SnoaL-like domain-containing protein n=1 Tax=Amniculicola lignicola CBS 123094 TaxID=1392246 RepID=A0A6A5W9Q1_9PLEO|nr:hypothetical protein P154DRAFT_440938 [Amniculicola lignicola CBS 123094]
MKFSRAYLLVAIVSIFEHVQSSLTLDSLARDVERVESIREIKDVTKTFAQLAQFGEWREMSKLFTSEGLFEWGNQTAVGPQAIATKLRNTAGNMDGIHPGSLNTMIIENPVISLSEDGQSAKGRWNGIRFMGDGAGGTLIQGGTYENGYQLVDGKWYITHLGYHAMYSGPYKGGWRNVGGALPLVPYHYTPESVGIPIPTPLGDPSPTEATAAGLSHRISRMNDEDDVRNLQHAYGFYIDRRMWSDVVDLFASDGSVHIRNVGIHSGAGGIRKSLEERMGPEGLTQGINNDHPIFGLIVEVHPNGKQALARGIEVGMIGDTKTRAASWEFNVFRNHFVKENGLWKLKKVDVTPLIVADYYQGWGNGSLAPLNDHVPHFLDITVQKSDALKGPRNRTDIDLEDLERRLRRSAAYDGAENNSHAYGFYADDLVCAGFGYLFAKKGHKASPFAGYFQTPERITQACFASYGTNRSTLRSSISFHWRPQPVILVSEDGRSATLRARLLQPSTSTTKAGSFNNAIYHDQVVLEDGKWRLWSVTIDEFYWQSSSWEGGWSAANPRNSSAPNPAPAAWISKYPPDISLVGVGDRESTFRGGSGNFIEWPDIQRMWFQYRNPVSGRLPEYYWPGCVPCKAKPEWALTANGYQEPATGPDGS